MISSGFKKQIANSLKNDYDIDCHRISPIPEHGNFRWSTLHCSHNGEKFTMMMKLTVDKGDHDGVVGSFKVILTEMYAHKIESINKKINLDLINDSVSEVCKEMSQYLSGYHLSFLHSSVDLIKGLYIKNGKNFDVKKIESRIESNSCIMLHTQVNAGHQCCYVKIINNEITLKPETAFEDEPIFNEASTLVDGGMDMFKANLMRSVFFFMKSLYLYDKRYDVDIDLYLPLTYDELKQQFLVNDMAKI